MCPVRHGVAPRGAQLAVPARLHFLTEQTTAEYFAAPMAIRSPTRTGIRQVAKKARVAISSVSRVISGHPDVSPRMRERVQAAVKALGYEPDILAQSLRRGSTRTVGFLIGDISNPLSAQIALGAELELQERDHATLMVNSLDAATDDAAQLRLLRQRRVDGFLLSLSDETDPATLVQLKTLDKPFVLIDRRVQGISSAAVLSDHAVGMNAAAEHLIKLGHRRIGLIAGGRAVLPTYARADALLAACDAHRGVRALVEYGTYSAAHGEAATGALLSRHEAPTALIAGGNQMLPGVLRALRRRRLRIPRDISLITCDSTPLAEFLEPPLATISRDTRELGRVSAQQLLEVLRGAPPHRIVLPTSFAPGLSCGPPHDARKGRGSRR